MHDLGTPHETRLADDECAALTAVAVPSPSVAFVGYSAKDAAEARRFDAQADFVIRELSPGPALWHDKKFGIYTIKKSPHS